MAYKFNPFTGNFDIDNTTAPGAGAPADGQYVVLAYNAGLSAERLLTGTADQITITDAGAGSTVTLSTPQDINTTSSPTFAGLTLTTDLSIANGGTGQSTAQAAIDALTAVAAATNEYVLTKDTGTGNAIWKVSTGAPEVNNLETITTGIAANEMPVGTGVNTVVYTATTGTGAPVRATSPTLVTPALGTPSAAVLTNATGLPISTGVSGLGANVATWLGTPSSANLIAAVTDETGSGALVFATSPTLVTPALGTPASGTLTNCTGLPISTGVSGLAANVATFLGTPSSANLASAVTDETGTGALVFANTPTFVTPVLGAATGTSITLGGAAVPTVSSTSTFTNKRITERVVTTASDTTAVIDIDDYDQYELTAMAGDTTFSITGTPTDGQKIIVRCKDNGTTRALTWTGFTEVGVTLPTASTASKWIYVGAIYNLGATTWHAVAVSEEA